MEVAGGKGRPEQIVNEARISETHTGIAEMKRCHRKLSMSRKDLTVKLGRKTDKEGVQRLLRVKLGEKKTDKKGVQRLLRVKLGRKTDKEGVQRLLSVTLGTKSINKDCQGRSSGIFEGVCS